MPGQSFTFGPFSVGDATGLLRTGNPIEIGQKALSVLLELVRADGQPLSKAHLLEACWPGQIVEEGNLTVQIAALRKALGHTELGLDWIVTVPRLGYRLLKELPVADQVRATAFRTRTVAIFPFKNLSGDPAHDYVAAGMTADITSALTRYKSLNVHPAVHDDSPAKMRAEKLNVSHLIEGTAMVSGSKLRIIVSLIDGAAGDLIWNQCFDANMTDIFAVLDEITSTVASRIEPAISEQEIHRARRLGERNLSAHDLFLRARHLLFDGRESAVREAFSYLKKALEHDPNDAKSAGLMCEVFLNAHATGSFKLTDNDQQWGEHYARLCIALADGDANIMAQGATGLLHMSQDFASALAVAEKAYQSNPNDFDAANVAGLVHLHCGDINLAVQRYELALRQGPTGAFSRFSRTGLAHALIILGNFEDALQHAAISMAAASGFAPTFWMLAASNAHLGKLEDGRKWVSMLLERWPHSTISSIREGQPKFKPERIDPVLRGLILAGLPDH